jgi:tetratricopeptide (TPR) repeat protein
MKILILTLWCLVPLGLVAFHYGPGQKGVALDRTGDHLSLAANQVKSGNWPQAIEAYEQALAALPKDRAADAAKIRLEIAKARMQSGHLPQARTELEQLAKELEADPASDHAVRDDALATLASSRFYMAYLMKLEGLPEAEWEPEIEAARQERKLLVQRANEAGDTQAAAKYADDLESAIRLARTDPAELYGKAIPKPCNCKSGKCKKPSPKPAAKQKDARGASSGPPIDGQGS